MNISDAFTEVHRFELVVNLDMFSARTQFKPFRDKVLSIVREAAPAVEDTVNWDFERFEKELHAKHNPRARRTCLLRLIHCVEHRLEAAKRIYGDS